MKNEQKTERKAKKKREESLMIPGSGRLTVKEEKEPKVNRTTSKSALIEAPSADMSPKSPDIATVIKPVDVEVLKFIEQAVNQLNNEQTVQEQLILIANIVR